MSDEHRIYTLKEIADELKVDKQRVYRFVRNNHISEAHHDVLRCDANLIKNGVKYYDEIVKQQIFEAFIRGNSESRNVSSILKESHHEVRHDVICEESMNQSEAPCAIHKGNEEIEFLRQQILSMNKQIASRDVQIRQQVEVITSLNRELEKEREHNREKDRQLIDTLSKLAETQAALAVGQSAEKQKALAETLIEKQQVVDGNFSETTEFSIENFNEESYKQQKKGNWLERFLKIIVCK